MADTTVVRAPGDGDALWVLGGLYEVKAAAEETNGSMTIMEMTIPAGMGPPPHSHSGGEAVYVLDGHCYYTIDGVKHEGGPGTLFYIPAGVVENFEPAGEKPLRVLVIYQPGGIDEFFHEVGEPAQTRDVPPRSETPPDIEQITRAGKRYGLEIKA